MIKSEIYLLNINNALAKWQWIEYELRVLDDKEVRILNPCIIEETFQSALNDAKYEPIASETNDVQLTPTIFGLITPNYSLKLLGKEFMLYFMPKEDPDYLKQKFPKHTNLFRQIAQRIYEDSSYYFMKSKILGDQHQWSSRNKLVKAVERLLNLSSSREHKHNIMKRARQDLREINKVNYKQHHLMLISKYLLPFFINRYLRNDPQSIYHINEYTIDQLCDNAQNRAKYLLGKNTPFSKMNTIRFFNKHKVWTILDNAHTLKRMKVQASLFK